MPETYRRQLRFDVGYGFATLCQLIYIGANVLGCDVGDFLQLEHLRRESKDTIIPWINRISVSFLLSEAQQSKIEIANMSILAIRRHFRALTERRNLTAMSDKAIPSR